MEFGLLGTLEVRAGDRLLPLRRPKQRALLALLLLHANRVLGRDRLIDELWGEDPPETAVKALQTHVSQLRKLLPAGMLVTRAPGYVLEVDPETIDLWRFERLVAEARTSDPARASELLGEALALWCGTPLSEFEEPFARVEAARLEALRVVALEERIDAELSLGRHAELTGELELLVAEHPHRDRLRGQLMVALYRSGRQAEALAAYRDARTALGELGLEPGSALRELERRILTHDTAVEAPRAGLLGAAFGGRAPLPGPFVPTPAFPFVGRSDELALLRSLLARAENGEGGVALIAAEAGGGKTRLVRELAFEAAAHGAVVLYGASDAMVRTPYQPLREWLELLLRICDPGALAECLRGGAGEQVSRLLPGLARVAGSPAPPTGDPESDRFLLQGAAVELLSRAAGLQPLLAVADDVHWADVETLHLLRRLGRSAPESRLLVVATYRDSGEELIPAFADTVADLSRLEAITRISLGRLTDGDVADFIRASTDAVATGDLASEIADLTGGTPLVICELWRDLRDRDAIEIADGGVRLTRPIAEMRGPERLRDVVRHRLSRLAPETAATLELAAVFGPRFELGVLATAAGLRPPELASAIAEAIRRGLVEELPDAVPACQFTHELVRRAVYDAIGGMDRAALHLRVGEALERAHTGKPERGLPELAHHFTLAAPVAGVERAVAYVLRAAHAAIAAGAFEDAAARFSSALELGIADRRERARVQVELGYLLHQLGRMPDADAMLAASLDAAAGLEERGIAAYALLRRTGGRLADPEHDLEKMRTVAEAAVETFTELGDARGLAVAERYLSIALTRMGHTADAAAVLERALAHAGASGDPGTRRDVIGTLGNILCSGPTPVRDAIRRLEELLRSSRNDHVLEAVINRFLSVLVAMSGRPAEALELLRASSLVLDDVNYLTPSRTFRYAAAQARAIAGDRAGAERELLEMWRGFPDTDEGIDERALNAASHLAVLYCDEDRWDDVAKCLVFGDDVSLTESTGAAIRRLAAGARLAAHEGRAGEAVTLALRAVESAEHTDFPELRAVAWLALAEARRAGGETAEADAAVAEAIRLYEAKGNVAAVAGLAALGQGAPAAPAT